MALTSTEIDQKFSAVKEHGEELASKFKAFVKDLNDSLPDGVSKKQLMSYLEISSQWAHTALDDAAQMAKNALHQRTKSGEKPETTEPQSTPPSTTPVEDTSAGTTPTDPTPVVDTPPAS